VKGVGYGLEEGEIGVWFPAETRVSFVLQRPKRFWNQPCVLLQLVKLWRAYPRWLLREFIWHLAFTGLSH